MPIAEHRFASYVRSKTRIYDGNLFISRRLFALGTGQNPPQSRRRTSPHNIQRMRGYCLLRRAEQRLPDRMPEIAYLTYA